MRNKDKGLIWIFPIGILVIVLCLAGIAWTLGLGDNVATERETAAVSDAAPEPNVEIYWNSGYRMGGVKNKTGKPKIVIDTVRFVGSGSVTMLLNTMVSEDRSYVAASEPGRLIVASLTQILATSGATINKYAAYLTDEAELVIKSDNASDSSQVVVMLLSY